MWAALAALAALGCLALPIARAQPTYEKYNPCAPLTPLNKGDLLVIGLAFWPGGTIEGWGPDPSLKLANGSDAPGLNPCVGSVELAAGLANYQSLLGAKGAWFASYGVGVDTMAALRTTKAEDDQLFDLTVSKNAEQVVSVVAFHGAVRSEPRYVRSASGGTGGQGQVLELGLLASLDGGVLTALEWDNLGGCADCGGTSSATCVQTEYDASRQTNPQESCAAPLDSPECACRGLACAATNCTATYLVAFRGATASGQPLQSAYQLTAAYSLSISSTVTGLFNSAGSQLGSVEFVSEVGGGVAVAQPLPLPGGAQADASLAAAQAGVVLPPPPPPEAVAAPVAAPAAVPAPVAAAAPVVVADPAAAAAPVVVADPAAAAAPVVADPAAAAAPVVVADPAAAAAPVVVADPAAAAAPAVAAPAGR